MTDSVNAFEWITGVLSDVRLEPGPRILATCQDDTIGRLIEQFSYASIESLLELTDDELVQEHPTLPCPIGFQARQLLKRTLKDHVVRCLACFETELRHEAEFIQTARTVRLHSQGEWALLKT